MTYVDLPLVSLQTRTMDLNITKLPLAPQLQVMK